MENYLFGSSGSFCVGYRIFLPEKFSLGEEDYDLLNEYWGKSLRDLPIGSIFFKQDIFKQKKYDASEMPSRNFLEKSTKKHFEGRNYLEHTTNIFFVLPNQSIKLKRLTNPIRPPQKKMFEEFDANIENFLVAVKQTVEFLENIKLSGGNGIKIIPLEKNYINTYYDYINSGLNENLSVDIKNRWKYLSVGNQLATIIKFPNEDKFPEKLQSCRKDDAFSNDKSVFFKNYGDNFSFDLNFNHIYNQICVIDDNKEHYNEAKKNNENLKKFKQFDAINEHWGKETDVMLQEMARFSDVERIVRGHNNVIIFADSEIELENRINKVAERFKDIDIKGHQVFGDNLLAIYEYSFPLNAHLFIDNHFYIASLDVFNSFLIISGKYNDDDEGILYNSRLDNTPVKVDVWDAKKKNINARNFFILAPTGFGKSFNANHVISHFYAEGAKQVIIDLGGSYKKLSTLFPNDIAYITYNEGDNLGINPFELKVNKELTEDKIGEFVELIGANEKLTEDKIEKLVKFIGANEKLTTDKIEKLVEFIGANEKLTTDKIEELVEFIGVHFRRTSELSENERASLRKVVELYYKKVENNHSLPSFVDYFIKEKDDFYIQLGIKKEYFDGDEFILLMSEFTKGGVYSFLYDETKESFGANLVDKKIIIFELDKIRENKMLLSIMLQLISSTITKVIWRDQSTRGVILFDEVAEQLHWDGMLRRIQWFYQAIRKQNGSIGIILQAVSQLPENHLSKSILENTQILYVLNAKDYRALQKRFNLSEHAYYQLCSINSNFKAEYPYSEIFIMRGNKHQVYRLEVSKEVFWAYQTDGEDNQKLMDIYQRVGNMEEAIEIKINQ